MASRENKNGGDFVLESRHLVGLFMLLVVIFGVVFTLGYLLGRSQYDARLRAAVGPPPEADSPPAGRAGPAATPALKSKGKPQSTGASSTGSVPKQDAAPSQKNSDWDFYHSAEPKTAEDHLQAAKKSVAATPPARQPADAKPAALAGEGRSSAASGKSAAVPPKPAPSPPNNSAPPGLPLVANGAIMLQVAAVIREGDAMALAQALQQKKFPAFVITPGADKYFRVQVGPYADTLSATNARHDLEANGFKSIVKR
jgi:cell division septation protein DedD